MRRTIALVLFLAGPALFAAGEIVYLKDGTILEGYIRSQNSERIVIETPDGELSVEKSAIRRIAYSSANEHEFAQQIKAMQSEKEACDAFKGESQKREDEARAECARKVEEAKASAERDFAARSAKNAQSYNDALRGAALRNMIFPGYGYDSLHETRKAWFFGVSAATALGFYYREWKSWQNADRAYRKDVPLYSSAAFLSGSPVLVSASLIRANDLRFQRDRSARRGGIFSALFLGLYAAGVAEPLLGRESSGPSLSFESGLFACTVRF